MRRHNFEPKPDDRFRTIPETSIIGLLLLVSWAFELDAGDRDRALGATSKALDTWVGNGLGYRLSTDGQRLFDPVEVINFLKWAGVTQQDPYWEEHFVKTHRGFIDEFRPGEIGSCRSSDYAPNRFRFAVRRTFDLQSFAKSASVRLRAPMLLAGSYLADVQARPVVPEEYQSDMIVRDQCLEVRLKAPAVRAVTIGADFTFTATSPASGPGLTRHEFELYCRKSEGFIQVTPRIEALAHEISGGSSCARKAVEGFWGYMMGTLCSGMIRYCDVPPDAPGDFVLDHGWYDCQLGSALLASLCRARGIPARIVSGFLLYRVQPISHFWAEVWLEDTGWCPFDVICWDLSRGGLDHRWRDHFAGQIDYRVVTQCFPLVFTGPMSVRFPPAWHMVQVAAGRGVDIAFTDVNDQSLIYRDHAEVENLGPV